ncbi:MAG: metallophosphoesterase [SAR324 cluster bacterium]|nr:metallophosphoesterase [SAR324 cluster bacterium]
MIRICCMSDTHKMHNKLDFEQLQTANVALHCGDFGGTDWEETRDFLEWFGSLKASYKILVPGNHDYWMMKLQQQGGKYELNGILSRYGISYPDRSVLVINLESRIIHCAGLSYDSTYRVEQGIDIVGNRWHDRLDLFLSHNPPHGILDKIGSLHIGDPILLDIVKKHLKPRYHIFGHCHESYGVFKTSTTIFMNAALQLNQQQTIRPVLWIEL